MVTRYASVFEIQIRHAYFGDGVCRLMHLAPTPECERLMGRNACLFRKLDGGGALYCDTAEALNETRPFVFTLRAPLPELAHSTDIAPDSQVYYFDNLGTNTPLTIKGQEFCLLHEPEKPVNGNAIPVSPPRFTYTFAAPVDPADVVVFDAQGLPVWKPPAADRQIPSLLLDLSALPEGRYRLQVKGATVHDFLLSTMAAAGVWGVIAIYPCASDTRFAISLLSRKSIWRYYVISQSPADRTYDNFTIAGGPPKGSKSNGTPAIEFAPPQRQRINGKEAWVFESSDTIPLYEYPGDHYDLSLNAKGKNNGTSLPYARSETTRLERTAAGELRYCSEIYLYL